MISGGMENNTNKENSINKTEYDIIQLKCFFLLCSPHTHTHLYPQVWNVKSWRSDKFANFLTNKRASALILHTHALYLMRFDVFSLIFASITVMFLWFLFNLLCHAWTKWCVLSLSLSVGLFSHQVCALANKFLSHTNASEQVKFEKKKKKRWKNDTE